MAEEKSYNKAQEEIEYLKEENKSNIRRLEELQSEYEEFRTNSEDLERELETELKQCKSKIYELTSANQKLESELDALRIKYDDQFKSDYRRISELEAKVMQAESYTLVLQKYIRELEQSNDDLERAKRAAIVSLEDFELRLNQAIERNAFLESELDEKEDLVICVQRLKDETRDLKQEIAIQDMRTDRSDKGEINGSVCTNVDQSERTAASLQPPNMSCYSARSKLAAAVDHTNTFKSFDYEVSRIPSPSNFTQASRISALNIVGDVLRRVSALESKLSACRTLPYGVAGDNSTASLAHNSTVQCA